MIAGVGGAILVAAIAIIAFCLLSRRRGRSAAVAARQSRLARGLSVYDEDGMMAEKPFQGSTASLRDTLPAQPKVHNSFFGLGAVLPPAPYAESTAGHRRSLSSGAVPPAAARRASSEAGSRRGSLAHGLSTSASGLPLTAEAVAALDTRPTSPAASRRGSEIGSGRLRSPTRPWVQPLGARSSLDRLMEDDGGVQRHSSRGSDTNSVVIQQQMGPSRSSRAIGHRPSMQSIGGSNADEDFVSADEADELTPRRGRHSKRLSRNTGY